VALALVVEDINSVPEALRGEYAQKDGKYHLNVDGLEDTGGLKTALSSEREKARALEAQIRQWAKLGKKPDEVEAMLESERKEKEAALLKAGKFDEVLAQHLGAAKQERDTAVTAAEAKAKSALDVARKAIVGNNVASALAKGKATAEGLTLLPRILGDRIKIEFGEDGTETVAILDADGKTPMVGSGKGGLATFDDLVKEAVKNYPSLFEGSGAGGSGTPPRNAGGAGKTISRKDFDALGPVERAAKVREGIRPVD
jgi:hypothetical protein